MRKTLTTAAVVLALTLTPTTPAHAAAHTRETTLRTPESVVRVVRELLKRLTGGTVRTSEKPVGPVPS